MFASANDTIVEFAAAEDSVSPGQACVFYSFEQPRARVLGGGFIVSADRACPGFPENDFTKVQALPV
jgi:tRNA-uridine 2-sulfurtransferase